MIDSGKLSSLFASLFLFKVIQKCKIYFADYALLNVRVVHILWTYNYHSQIKSLNFREIEMDKLEVSDRTVSLLAAYAERMIGYIFSGLLPLLILTIEAKSMVKGYIEATGGILAALICIGLGIGIFSIYFRIIGELILYPLQHCIHILLDFCIRRRGDKQSSTVGLLVHYGVPILRCRDAYQTIKDEFFKKRERTEMQFSHGEIHVVYLTSVITMVAYFVVNYTKGQASKLYIFISVVSLIAAIISDTRQHSKEAYRIRAEKNAVIKFLSDRGYINTTR